MGEKIHNVLDLIANLFTVLQQKDFFAYMHHNRKVVQVYYENELHDECFLHTQVYAFSNCVVKTI